MRLKPLQVLVVIPLLISSLPSPVLADPTNQPIGASFIDVRSAFSVPPLARPSYDAILIPLRQVQAEKARVDALRAAQVAAQALADQLAQQQQQAAYTASQAVVTYSGSCAEWLAAAGVTDTASAMTLINRESGCNARAVNASSGACNVAQELPCGKSGCTLGDGACSVRWMSQYVIDRYGSFSGALAHSNQYGWY
jgi:hypothetical protein